MDEITITSTFQLGKVQINYAEIESAVKAKTAHYATVIVTEEAIPEFTQARADMNKVIKQLSDERIRIKKTWNEPVVAMETEINRISKIAQDAVTNLDDQLKEYEAKRIEGQTQTLQALFDTQGIKDIPFTQILKPAWLNKGNAGKANDLLITECERIKGDLEFIEATEDKAEAVLVRDNYLKSLDLLTAQSQARQTLAQVRRAEELRRQSEAILAQNSARLEAEAKARLDAVNQSVILTKEENPIYQRDIFAESFEKPEAAMQPTPILQPFKPLYEQTPVMPAYAISFPDAVEFNEAIEALNNAKVKYNIL